MNEEPLFQVVRIVQDRTLEFPSFELVFRDDVEASHDRWVKWSHDSWVKFYNNAQNKAVALGVIAKVQQAMLRNQENYLKDVKVYEKILKGMRTQVILHKVADEMLQEVLDPSFWLVSSDSIRRLNRLRDDYVQHNSDPEGNVSPERRSEWNHVAGVASVIRDGLLCLYLQAGFVNISELLAELLRRIANDGLESNQRFWSALSDEEREAVVRRKGRGRKKFSLKSF